MFLSKKITLALLLPFSLAFAHVQLEADIDICLPKQEFKKTVYCNIKLDKPQSFTVCDDNDMNIEGELLAQKENIVFVRYSFSKKNDAGDFEVLYNPELVVELGKSGSVNIGDSNGDSFDLTVNATETQE